MSSDMALDLAYRTIFTAASIMAPVLISAIVVGILVNVIQTVTSIKDMSLTFVPKIAVSAVVLGFSLPWIIQTMTGFFQEIYSLFGRVGG